MLFSASLVGNVPSNLVKRNFSCQGNSLGAQTRKDLYFGSTGFFPFSHSFQPPLSANTLEYPAFMNCCATRALVYSFVQAQ
jgi:hypothetical protein